jgi:hypothetical protein
MQQFPKISEVIEQLMESDEIGTKEDKFARGCNLLKYPNVLKGVDYLLTAIYLTAYIGAAAWVVFKIVA